MDTRFPRLCRPLLLRAALILNWALFAAVGFWPFNFRQPNLVAALPHEPGLRFEGMGIAYSERSIEPAPGADFTIELLLEPEAEPRRGIPCILSIYDGSLPENLMLGQWRSGLVVRTAIEGAGGGRRYRESGAERVLRKGERHLVTMSSGSNGTTYYLDGRPVARQAAYRPGRAALRGRLVLGSSVTGGSPWQGNLLGAAIIARSLDDAEIEARRRAWYTRDEDALAAAPDLLALYLMESGREGVLRDRSGNGIDLLLPDRFAVLRRVAFAPPHGQDLRDLVINVLGFVPFGFLLAACLGGRGRARRLPDLLIAIAAGALTSAGIEAVQILLPTRSSTIMDVLANTLGTALGALSATAFRLPGSPRNQRAQA